MIYTLSEHGDWLRFLTEDCDPTDPEIKKLADQLLETVAGKGVGLAAPQIGRYESVFVAQFGGPAAMWTVACNPHIMLRLTGDPKKDILYTVEGCLSIPDEEKPGEYKMYALQRSGFLTLIYFDLHGELQKRDLSGWDAVIAQHEYDHLNKTLICDHGKAVLSVPEDSEEDSEEDIAIA